jgi:hypothetical protein
MKHFLAVLLCFAVLSVAAADTFRDYQIQIGSENPAVDLNPFGAGDTDFTAGRWWGSVGADLGLNFPNDSARTIYGMWLKVKFPKPDGGQGDTFTTNSTGGTAFPEVWRKKDGSQLIFRGPGVAPGASFWMKVPKTDDTDLRNRFFAQLYGDKGKPDVPQDGTWERISRPDVAPITPGARRKSTEPPLEIRQKAFAFAQAVEDSPAYSADLKKAISRGAAFYGKPYFLGGSDQGNIGFFTFWLYNPNDKTYKAFSLDITKPTGTALMKTVLFAFERQAQWIAVYTQSQSLDRPLYVTVYP